MLLTKYNKQAKYFDEEQAYYVDKLEAPASNTRGESFRSFLLRFLVDMTLLYIIISNVENRQGTFSK